MNIGQAVIWFAFLTSLGATYTFFRQGRFNGLQNTTSSKAGFPSTLFAIGLAAGLLASILLIDFLLTHQFQYTYVAKYSSFAQPMAYLISAFWAGQEGTFLLWAVVTGIMGIIFLKKSRQQDGYAMTLVSAYIAFLYLLILVKSPFEVAATIPRDGSGMNPLLQDPWMVIHPPILFIGYAATIFPFALVVSGLIRRNYDHWFAIGFPWTLFAASTLGAGIIIGGFWAYEVLGWGGYWGWDPVENSSLVPWLTLLALIHGLLVQKSKGSLVRTNLFLAIVSFLLVLYATFLTRSGVLADFSVHSFVDLGINSYLIAVMVVGVALGFGLFAIRFRGIKSPKIDFLSINRELALVLSLVVISAGALFTFVGMSSPILTGFIGKASQVDTSFYNKVNLPVAICIATLLGITPFLGWIEEKKFAFVRRLSMPLALTLLSCVIAWVAGVNTTTLMLFVGTASFGLISNVIVAFRQYRSGWLNLGGPIAHIGVALLLIGIVGSGKFDGTKQLILRQGEPQDAYGHQLKFTGIEENSKLKPVVKIEVSDGNNTYLATPKLYYSEYNQATMREPDIKIYPLSDLYISPIELKTPESAHSHNAMYEITKGETKEIGGYQVTFARFEMGSHGQEGAMTVGAVLNVAADGKNHEVIPQLTYDQRGEQKILPAEMPHLQSSDGVSPHISLNAISVEERKVMLELHGLGARSDEANVLELLVEVSTKPLMMVVWTGVVLIIVGSIAAFWKRCFQTEP